MKNLMISACAAASLLAFTVLPCQATIIANVGPDPQTFYGNVVLVGPFSDDVIFSITHTTSVVHADLTHVLGHQITGLTLDLFSGSPGSGSLLVSKPATLVGGSQRANISDTVAAGNYFIEVNGTAPAKEALAGTITVFTTAVPEPSTWAMLILGFAGVGFMAYRRKSSGSAFWIA